MTLDQEMVFISAHVALFSAGTIARCLGAETVALIPRNPLIAPLTKNVMMAITLMMMVAVIHVRILSAEMAKCKQRSAKNATAARLVHRALPVHVQASAAAARTSHSAIFTQRRPAPQAAN